MLFDIRLHNVFLACILGHLGEEVRFFHLVVCMDYLDYYLAEDNEICLVYRLGDLFAL
jgi:hypothetical protein